jgi:microcystin-dependent protein
MSNYVKATDFASKDALTTGDPAKKVKGTEINTEFNAIATAVATKADLASPVFTGSPQAPSASGSEDSTRIATTEWVRDFLNSFLNTYEPIGTIKVFGPSGTIPTGWQLCDGTNSTPDLRDRFIVGAGSTYSAGNTGGANTVTLATSEIPSHAHGVSISSGAISADHSHTFNVNSGGQSQSHTHTVPMDSATGPGSFNSGFVDGSTPGTVTTGAASQDHVHNVNGTTSGVSANHYHDVVGNTATAGSGGAHENRPPYYAVRFIIKTTNLS